MRTVISDILRDYSPWPEARARNHWTAGLVAPISPRLATKSSQRLRPTADGNLGGLGWWQRAEDDETDQGGDVGGRGVLHHATAAPLVRSANGDLGFHCHHRLHAACFIYSTTSPEDPANFLAWNMSGRPDFCRFVVAWFFWVFL